MSSNIYPFSPDDMDYIVETWMQARRADAKVSVYGVIDILFDDDGSPCEPREEVYQSGITASLINLIKLIEIVADRSPADDWFLDISY